MASHSHISISQSNSLFDLSTYLLGKGHKREEEHTLKNKCKMEKCSILLCRFNITSLTQCLIVQKCHKISTSLAKFDHCKIFISNDKGVCLQQWGKPRLDPKVSLSLVNHPTNTTRSLQFQYEYRVMLRFDRVADVSKLCR